MAVVKPEKAIVEYDASKHVVKNLVKHRIPNVFFSKLPNHVVLYDMRAGDNKYALITWSRNSNKASVINAKSQEIKEIDTNTAYNMFIRGQLSGVLIYNTGKAFDIEIEPTDYIKETLEGIVNIKKVCETSEEYSGIQENNNNIVVADSTGKVPEANNTNDINNHGIAEIGTKEYEEELNKKIEQKIGITYTNKTEASQDFYLLMLRECQIQDSISLPKYLKEYPGFELQKVLDCNLDGTKITSIARFTFSDMPGYKVYGVLSDDINKEYMKFSIMGRTGDNNSINIDKIENEYLLLRRQSQIQAW